MSAAKSGLLGKLVGTLSGSGRVPVAAVMVCVVLAGLVYTGWRRYGHVVVSDSRYRLTVDKFDVTPLPKWITSDVTAEVVRDGSLTNTSLLDPDATVHIAQAFRLHSWVASVQRVSKHPQGRVTVQLAYRRPVAMVEVQGGLLPVDVEGVLLPPRDFSATGARRYPRIAVGNSRPLGPRGTPWGDTRVVGAAQIAAQIGTAWEQLQLYRIVASPLSGNGPKRAQPSFELFTKGGVRIIWGHAPMREAGGEATASTKLARLIKYVEKFGPLDVESSAQQIDLRDPHSINVVPNTARLPADAPK